MVLAAQVLPAINWTDKDTAVCTVINSYSSGSVKEADAASLQSTTAWDCVLTAAIQVRANTQANTQHC